MKLIKEIKSKDGELHFRRWRLFSTPWFDVNIHGIYMNDQDAHMHNHPWNIWTMILWGSYSEMYHTDTRRGYDIRIRTLFDIKKSDTSKYHMIYIMRSEKVFTLAIMSKRKGDWGYLVDGKHVDHKTYRQLKREGKL